MVILAKVFSFGVGVLGMTRGAAVPDVVDVVIDEVSHGRENADLGLESATFRQKQILEFVL